MIAQVSLLSLGLGLCLGWLIGNFMEWNSNFESRKELRLQLRQAYLEADELRSILYATNGAEIRQLDTQFGKGK
jgi:hypothetical protein